MLMLGQDQQALHFNINDALQHVCSIHTFIDDLLHAVNLVLTHQGWFVLLNILKKGSVVLMMSTFSRSVC